MASVQPPRLQAGAACFNLLCGPTLHLPQYVPVSLVLGSTGLNTVLRLSLTSAEERGMLICHPPTPPHLIRLQGAGSAAGFPRKQS